MIVITFIKGIARKLILYSTEPGIRELAFSDIYLHKVIKLRICIICNSRFWTMGESEVCRKIPCYMVYKTRKEVTWPD